MNATHTTTAAEGFILSDGVVRADAFTNRPPSPPAIHVPTDVSYHRSDGNPFPVEPSLICADAIGLTLQEVQIITGTLNPTKYDGPAPLSWRYEDRRKAQSMLDYLYLGPLSVVRDRAWLHKEGITMLLAARDATFAQARLMSLERTANELGIEAGYVDVANRQELIQSFPAAVNMINTHMLRVHHASGGAQRGKVLVFCETGSDRSAAIVAAYLMAMYGRDIVAAIQFVGLRRFCTTFDDDIKLLLRSYDDILNAKRMVAQEARMKRLVEEEAALKARTDGGAMSDAVPIMGSKKRGIEDTMDVDEVGEFSIDMARYENREPFAPFLQEDHSLAGGAMQ